MKKKKFKNILYWLKDALLKGLAVFLIVAAGFYAYAAILWPAEQPNAVSGTVGMFVGDSVDSNRAGNQGVFNSELGYKQANDFCSTHSDLAIAGSHVCTPDEMINSYNHGTPLVSPVYTYAGSATLWINNGPPAFTANANDCKGWVETSSPDTNPNYGTVWIFDTEAGGLLPCRTGKAYACCR